MRIEIKGKDEKRILDEAVGRLGFSKRTEFVNAAIRAHYKELLEKHFEMAARKQQEMKKQDPEAADLHFKLQIK